MKRIGIVARRRRAIVWLYMSCPVTEKRPAPIIGRWRPLHPKYMRRAGSSWSQRHIVSVSVETDYASSVSNGNCKLHISSKDTRYRSGWDRGNLIATPDNTTPGSRVSHQVCSLGWSFCKACTYILYKLLPPWQQFCIDILSEAIMLQDKFNKAGSRWLSNKEVFLPHVQGHTIDRPILKI